MSTPTRAGLPWSTRQGRVIALGIGWWLVAGLVAWLVAGAVVGVLVGSMLKAGRKGGNR